MRRTEQTGLLVGLILASAGTAAAVGFVALYRLQDDPIPDLGATYRFAAFLQPIPFVLAAVLAVAGRHRRAVLWGVLVAVVVIGAGGSWWLSGLAEVRRIENEPARRRGLGNIFPDAEGQIGAVVAIVWPVLAAALIGLTALLVWAATRRTRRNPPRRPEARAHGPSLGAEDPLPG
jgi:hypothetical protein